MGNSPSRPEFDAGYEGHQHRQIRLGLELTPAQRLEWLERKLAEVRRLLGTARREAANSPLAQSVKTKAGSGT